MRAELVDFMGTDLSVVNAARVSFDKVSKWIRTMECDPVDGIYWEEKLEPSDEKLISYLAKHNHWTPFAHTAITLRMQAPIPIRTQCFKHKAGFVENEESRRYISTRPEVFMPDVFRSKPEGSIKQGSGEPHYNTEQWMGFYKVVTSNAISMYESMINDGVCPEQARFILPQGVEVQWIWTGNLASYARFYSLRTDSHAQKEVQDLAGMVGDIISGLYPVSWKALTQ